MTSGTASRVRFVGQRPGAEPYCRGLLPQIAEGCCRSQGDFGRFVQIAAGSASELEYQLLLAKDLNLLQDAEFQALSAKTIEVKRMLAALLSRLKADG